MATLSIINFNHFYFDKVAHNSLIRQYRDLGILIKSLDLGIAEIPFYSVLK